MTAWDVIVVGAGPAGACAALSALRERPSSRVLLLDRADFPRDKSCGDGVAPHVLDELAHLGVDGLPGEHPELPVLHLRSPGIAVRRTMRRPAHAIPRTEFDARILDAARRAGAVFRRQAVRALERDGDGVLVDGADRARVLIGADGAESAVRRFLLPGRHGRQARRASSTAVAIRGYAPLPADTPREQLIAMTGGRWPSYAWLFPIDARTANVGYGELVTETRLTRADLLAKLEKLLPGVRPEPSSLLGHRLPLSTGRMPVPAGNVLLAGDAQSLINPLTGEGIFFAVRSGVLAGHAAVHEADPGRWYGHELLAEFGRHWRHTRLLTRLDRWPAVARAGLRAGARSQGVFDDVVELGLAAGPVTPRVALSLAGQLALAR